MACSPNPPGALGAPLPNRPPVNPPPANPPRPLPQLPVRGAARVTRNNAIHLPSSPASLSLNNIPLNGKLVNKALGLTPGVTPPPPKARSQLPPMKASSVNYRTLPLPQPPIRIPKWRRQGLIILLPADLPEELRNIQLETQLTQDDST
ncbi:hypothetical protein PCANC_02096 [Puccinia coronata f. sp. avenae]|uniref:Uncharacterized protein n=1 Tax=Puccinia coronata f. sp. avenae TaxID=200324 RepID=A0A2N5VZW7_9BASI|nr:hypothetical protein PCANC_02096 [Puccinia coronata f. sp. avenae]